MSSGAQQIDLTDSVVDLTDADEGQTARSAYLRERLVALRALQQRLVALQERKSLALAGAPRREEPEEPNDAVERRVLRSNLDTIMADLDDLAGTVALLPRLRKAYGQNRAVLSS